jgi:hypothetical protein
MIDIILLSLAAGALAGLMSFLTAMEIATWCRQRRRAKIKWIEHELALAQQRLDALTMEHQAWLNAQAHEARKALIMESFLAPKDARTNTSSLTRRS